MEEFNISSYGKAVPFKRNGLNLLGFDRERQKDRRGERKIDFTDQMTFSTISGRLISESRAISSPPFIVKERGGKERKEKNNATFFSVPVPHYLSRLLSFLVPLFCSFNLCSPTLDRISRSVSSSRVLRVLK